MNRQFPVLRFRPKKVTDGEGGFTEEFGEPYEFCVTLQYHQNSVTMIVDANEDVKVDDVIVVEDFDVTET